MPHHTPLIGTIVVGLVVAFVMGAIAHRLKISPVAGYLLAGILVGPFTPGFVADSSLANELAEIGVILLMFGVGLHFSLRDLLSVKNIAVPGALVQIAVATLLGLGLAQWLGWSLITGIVFGLALSVASTVVLLRAMQSRDLIDTQRGRIAVGWLIVEDLVMVIALVLLPPLAEMLNGSGAGSGQQGTEILVTFGVTILKVGAFIALMLVVGRKAIPQLLHWAAHTGSRELFRLSVLATALGVAFGAAMVFHVSFALGAFFAGMILGETPLSRRATEETLPLRDAFAVLFFVSVGMLFNPAVLVEQPLPLLATVLIIVLGKSIAAFAIVRMFGHSSSTALTISASLAQIGEFSFILAGLGGDLGILPSEARDLILAGAIISIFINPFLFTLFVKDVPETTVPVADDSAVQAAAAEALRQSHTVVVGYGRVGKLVAEKAAQSGHAFTIIEQERDRTLEARAANFDAITGNATTQKTLTDARLQDATTLIIAIPEGFEAGAIAERARTLNPAIRIYARAHSDDEVAHLAAIGVDRIVLGEQEIADRLIEWLREK